MPADDRPPALHTPHSARPSPPDPPALAALRALVAAGVPPADPRCLALARLALVSAVAPVPAPRTPRRDTRIPPTPYAFENDRTGGRPELSVAAAQAALRTAVARRKHVERGMDPAEGGAGASGADAVRCAHFEHAPVSIFRTAAKAAELGRRELAERMRQLGQNASAGHRSTAAAANGSVPGQAVAALPSAHVGDTVPAVPNASSRPAAVMTDASAEANVPEIPCDSAAPSAVPGAAHPAAAADAVVHGAPSLPNASRALNASPSGIQRELAVQHGTMNALRTPSAPSSCAGPVPTFAPGPSPAAETASANTLDPTAAGPAETAAHAGLGTPRVATGPAIAGAAGAVPAALNTTGPVGTSGSALAVWPEAKVAGMGTSVAVGVNPSGLAVTPTSTSATVAKTAPGDLSTPVARSTPTPATLNDPLVTNSSALTVKHALPSTRAAASAHAGASVSPAASTSAAASAPATSARAGISAPAATSSPAATATGGRVVTIGSDAMSALAATGSLAATSVLGKTSVASTGEPTAATAQAAAFPQTTNSTLAVPSVLHGTDASKTVASALGRPETASSDRAVASALALDRETVADPRNTSTGMDVPTTQPMAPAGAPPPLPSSLSASPEIALPSQSRIEHSLSGNSQRKQEVAALGGNARQNLGSTTTAAEADVLSGKPDSHLRPDPRAETRGTSDLQNGSVPSLARENVGTAAVDMKIEPTLSMNGIGSTQKEVRNVSNDEAEPLKKLQGQALTATEKKLPAPPHRIGHDQPCEPMPSHLIFQAKAQLFALKCLLRGQDPPPEVLIASAGKRPRGKHFVRGMKDSQSLCWQIDVSCKSADQSDSDAAMQDVFGNDSSDQDREASHDADCRSPGQEAHVLRRDLHSRRWPDSDSVNCRSRCSHSDLISRREQRLATAVVKRLADIKKFPLSLPVDYQRKIAIEASSLRLLRLQRKVRLEVQETMRKVLEPPPRPGYDPSSVQAARRERPKHRPGERHPLSGINAHGATLSPEALARVRSLEESHAKLRDAKGLEARAKFGRELLEHASVVKAVHHGRHQQVKKLAKDVDRHFRDKLRDEDRKKKKEQQDRLRALRNHDEEEYLALLQNTKNTRLLQLVKQTDEYLSQLGAQVEAQKEAAQIEDGTDLVNKKRNTDEALGLEKKRKKLPEPNSQASPTKEQQKSAKGDTDDSLAAMRERRNHYYTITHSIKESVTQPSSLVGGKLKPYQLDGLEWMVSLYNNGLNGILADEMGLGKTIQTISLLTYLTEVKENPGPFLVIVPLSTVSNWVRELQAWAPSLRKIVYKGSPDVRRTLQTKEMIKPFNVLLTTYEFVVKDRNFLGKLKWKYIIIDEGHRMKNADCKLALTLGAKYRSKNRVLLTGTPLQNNLTELWALMNFLLPTIFSSADTFETWFNAPFQASSLGGSSELNEEEQLLVISRLHQVLRPFMLRRLKVDVETQLPDKVESVMRCNMSIWQRVLYRQMSNNVGISASGSVRTFNNVVMQLKKICNHPFLFYTDEELRLVDPDYLIRAAGKFEMLEHVFAKLRASGHRVLMFSQMTAALDCLGYFLNRQGIRFMRLDGTTKADDRQVMLEDFNKPDSPYFCFLLSTRAGGLGLNLQTADTVFIFDSDWNPMMDLQAQDRAHRIGQTKEVRVYRLITARSVEEKILERANQKLQMDAQVIQAGQFNNKSSETDRTEMLKEILQANNRDDAEGEDVPSLEEMNRMLARTEEEFDLFQAMDKDRLEKQAALGETRLLSKESQLPDWVLQPECDKSSVSRKELGIDALETHGRGRRKRTDVVYNDGLTDKEWTAVVEQDGDVAEASRMKKKRKLEDSGGLNAEVERDPEPAPSNFGT